VLRRRDRLPEERSLVDARGDAASRVQSKPGPYFVSRRAFLREPCERRFSPLALASADAATVGAAAIQLRADLGISNTDVGLLVTVTSLVAAAASLPFGVLADRVTRTRMLAATIVLWGVAMLWSATVSSFGELLLARLFLGAVTAAAGPVTASLVGDWFAPSERGRIYAYITSGELIGAAIGFGVTGGIATLSWRAAFVILALPAFSSHGSCSSYASRPAAVVRHSSPPRQRPQKPRARTETASTSRMPNTWHANAASPPIRR
jgi:MFS family permease